MVWKQCALLHATLTIHDLYIWTQYNFDLKNLVRRAAKIYFLEISWRYHAIVWRTTHIYLQKFSLMNEFMLRRQRRLPTSGVRPTGVGSFFCPPMSKRYRQTVLRANFFRSAYCRWVPDSKGPTLVGTNVFWNTVSRKRCYCK